jgi:hypothetical protein
VLGSYSPWSDMRLLRFGRVTDAHISAYLPLGNAC